MKLIIVESPAKARTITRFLGDGYVVASSYGHIRDLPASAKDIPARYKHEAWSRLGVNVDDRYAPIYIVSPDSRAQVAELKKHLKQADEILLATDEDREGEAISWHLLEVLEPKVPVRRITFHEITKEAITAALESPREIDMQLVRAQEGRRILDRLYGYSLSPVLWKKVRTKLSAGRVQSVAVRLVVEKEEERQAFRVARYCDVEATLGGEGLEFPARLQSVNGKRLAGGKDFDAATGELKAGENRLQLSEADAADLAAAALGAVPWKVTAVERKEEARRPAPPFTTSTLQQAASGRLKMTPQRVMRIAQRLYEGVGDFREGLITYMRTDSLTLSEGALAETAQLIEREYGAAYTSGPRRYRTSSKGAQEAHEAIRPTHVSRTPAQVAGRLDKDELAVYTLIWNRTVASQMTDARLDKTTADLVAVAGGRELIFRANGSVVKFPGFQKVYGDRGQDTVLPDLREGQPVGGPAAREPGGVDVLAVTHAAHETQPPARYTEASLIKKLEEEGIGRPSTYAAVIATIQSREYVAKKGGALLPTYIGIAVTHLLREHFNRYVDVAFTARMEEELDQIAEGKRDWVEFLDSFYRGGNGGAGLEKDIAAGLDRIEFPRIHVGDDPQTGAPIVLRIGRNYVSVNVEGDDERRATVPVDLLIDELTPERALDLITQRDRSREPIGRHPQTGQDIYVLTGPFGPYLQLGQQEGDTKPKRISLGAKTDLSTIDLDYALRLLSLPRVIGTDPATGKPVRAGLGRFGPYVECERVFASVTSVDELFTVTLEQALERIRNKNRRPVLRELGPHPETGLPLVICKGRYGPYVTDGKSNGTIGRDTDPEEVTVADAVALLLAAAERAKQNGGRSARGRKVAKKAGVGAKKVTARRTSAVPGATKKTAKKASKKTTKKATGKTVAKAAGPATKKAAARKVTPGARGSGNA